jgi:hypothetical protein
MRSARVVSLLGLLLMPSVAAAQEKNPFSDSWFWGAKGGMAFLRTEIARTEAPVVGIEWLITRSKYGLYVGLDQAYFDAVSTVNDAPTRGVVRRVDIRDLRRFEVAGYMFPVAWWEMLRPYFGLGYSFNFVVEAESEGSQFANAEARDTVLARIESAKTRSSIFATFGLQLDWRRFAPFVQASWMPTHGRSPFLINGRGFTYYVEGGLRYNFGTAIEKLR